MKNCNNSLNQLNFRFFYYRVFKYDTSVELVSYNDLKLQRKPVKPAVYSLPPDAEMFCGYSSLVIALEKAKSGALAYIGGLIQEGEQSLPQLLQYRIDHYEDLNINLIEANIRRVEQNVNTDPNFKWQPFRI